MQTVLLIDDDLVSLSKTSRFLSSSFSILTAQDGEKAWELLDKEDIDIIVCDWEMPRVTGLELCERIRSDNRLNKIPFLMLTSRKNIDDKEMAYKVYIDDYLVKPFELIELTLRIKSLLKRSSYKFNSDNEKIQKIEIDEQVKTITYNGIKVYLTDSEFQIIFFILKNKDISFTIDQLLEKVFNYPSGTGNPEFVRRHIWNIRKKFSTSGIEFNPIINKPGLGYSLSEELQS